MNTPFYYIVKAKWIIENDKNEIDFENKEYEFKDINPIEARKKAFEWYENLLDAFLQKFGKGFTSDKDAREILEPFFNHKTKDTFEDRGKIYNKYLYGGIAIYVKQNEYPEIEDDYLNDAMLITEGNVATFLKDVPIHSIGKGHSDFDFEMTDPYIHLEYLHALIIERKLYQHYRFDVSGQIQFIQFFDTSESGEFVEVKEQILKSPFDFISVNEPLLIEYERQCNEEIEVQEEEESEPVQDSDDRLIQESSNTKLEFFQYFVERALLEGEGENCEFKPSLIYNFKTQRGGIGVKDKIAQAICAFMNAHGGLLVIGVNDKREIVGLEHDFSLNIAKSDPRDFFKLEFDNMLFQFFSKDVYSLIMSDIIKTNDKYIFAAVVYPSKYPVFITSQSIKKFYVRTTASSIEIEDKEAIVKYCLQKWGKVNLE